MSIGTTFLEMSNGASDTEYVKLPIETPIKLNVIDIQDAEGTYNGETKEQFRFVYRVSENQSEEVPEGVVGQQYSDWINKPQVNPATGKLKLNEKSKLLQIILKMHPNMNPDDIGKTSLQELVLGQPIRAEFKAPNDNGYQYIALYKSPTKDQKKIEVEQSDEGGLSTEEVLAVFGDDSTE